MLETIEYITRLFHHLPVALIGLNDHLVIVLILALLLFGGKNIPKLMHGIGKGMGEFRKGLEEGQVAYSKAAHKNRELKGKSEDEEKEESDIT